MFCCTLLYVDSSIAIILMGKRELVALLNLSSWCLLMVERLFLAVPQGCLRFVIVVFPDHTHYFLVLTKGVICQISPFQSTHDLISIGNKMCFVTYDTFSSQRIDNLPYGKKISPKRGNNYLFLN